MNYLGHSCLESKEGVVLESRVEALEAKTVNIHDVVSGFVTVVSGDLDAGRIIAPNLLGTMLTFSGNPSNNTIPQYLNLSGTINNVFRNSLYEGSDAIYPVHNYVVAPFDATIKTLSWARIPWGPGYALEDGSVVQFEVNKVLVGTPCVIKGSTNFEYLNPGVEINTGQTVALRYVNADSDTWRAFGRVLMWASLIPTRHSIL